MKNPSTTASYHERITWTNASAFPSTFPSNRWGESGTFETGLQRPLSTGVALRMRDSITMPSRSTQSWRGSIRPHTTSSSIHRVTAQTDGLHERPPRFPHLLNEAVEPAPPDRDRTRSSQCTDSKKQSWSIEAPTPPTPPREKASSIGVSSREHRVTSSAFGALHTILASLSLCFPVNEALVRSKLHLVRFPSYNLCTVSFHTTIDIIMNCI